MILAGRVPLGYPILRSKQLTYSSSRPFLKSPNSVMAIWNPTTSVAEQRERQQLFKQYNYTWEFIALIIPCSSLNSSVYQVVWCFGWGALVVWFVIWPSQLSCLSSSVGKSESVVDSSPTRDSQFFFEKELLWASCVVLFCLALPCPRISWMIKVMQYTTIYMHIWGCSDTSSCDGRNFFLHYLVIQGM